MADESVLPEHPRLRTVARTVEEAGLSAEVLDAKWRGVFISSEYARTVGVDPGSVAHLYGISGLRRGREHRGTWRPDRESGQRWWEVVAPFMRYDVPEDDPDFDAIFDHVAGEARRVSPVAPPDSFTIQLRFELPGLAQSITGPGRFIYIRLRDEHGALAGMLVLAISDVPASLGARLSRGDLGMFARMDGLREPRRRPAGVLFADLVSSGDHSRRLPSQGYFTLIRDLTDLIDTTVAERGGIIGKHAGDGASALFIPDEGGESAAARATIEAARCVRDKAAQLTVGGAATVTLRVGIHWGATLTVGQVSTTGRLEVTALGDEMNEAARIEQSAQPGEVLASKNLVERLDDLDTRALGLDVSSLSYRPLRELTATTKAIRDAGAVAVVAV